MSKPKRWYVITTIGLAISVVVAEVGRRVEEENPLFVPLTFLVFSMMVAYSLSYATANTRSGLPYRMLLALCNGVAACVVFVSLTEYSLSYMTGEAGFTLVVIEFIAGIPALSLGTILGYPSSGKARLKQTCGNASSGADQ